MHQRLSVLVLSGLAAGAWPQTVSASRPSCPLAADAPAGASCVSDIVAKEDPLELRAERIRWTQRVRGDVVESSVHVLGLGDTVEASIEHVVHVEPEALDRYASAWAARFSGHVGDASGELVFTEAGIVEDSLRSDRDLVRLGAWIEEEVGRWYLPQDLVNPGGGGAEIDEAVCLAACMVACLATAEGNAGLCLPGCEQMCFWLIFTPW